MSGHIHWIGCDDDIFHGGKHGLWIHFRIDHPHTRFIDDHIVHLDITDQVSTLNHRYPDLQNLHHGIPQSQHIMNGPSDRFSSIHNDIIHVISARISLDLKKKGNLSKR